jgi:hypothetical protein
MLFLSACGVKGNPVVPHGSYMPSLMQNYPDIELKDGISDNADVNY